MHLLETGRDDRVVAEMVDIDAVEQAFEADVVELVAVEVIRLVRAFLGPQARFASDAATCERVFIDPVLAARAFRRQVDAHRVLVQIIELHLVVLGPLGAAIARNLDAISESLDPACIQIGIAGIEQGDARAAVGAVIGRRAGPAQADDFFQVHIVRVFNDEAVAWPEKQGAQRRQADALVRGQAERALEFVLAGIDHQFLAGFQLADGGGDGRGIVVRCFRQAEPFRVQGAAVGALVEFVAAENSRGAVGIGGGTGAGQVKQAFAARIRDEHHGRRRRIALQGADAHHGLGVHAWRRKDCGEGACRCECGEGKGRTHYFLCMDGWDGWRLYDYLKYNTI
ncbi:hypothetical protein D3C72_1371730 [compost metagenome]